MSNKYIEEILGEFAYAINTTKDFNWEKHLIPNTVKQIQDLINQSNKEAYKKGYVDGGVEEILRHESARKAVQAELNKGGE